MVIEQRVRVRQSSMRSAQTTRAAKVSAHTQQGMPLAKRMSRPLAVGCCAGALALALVFAGCGGQAHHNTTTGTTTQQTTGANSGSTTSTTTTGNASSAAQKVINLDNQTQNDANSMDNAQNDANTDYSNQDIPQQP